MSAIRTFNYCKICKKRIVAKVWKIHVMGKKHLHYTPNAIMVTGAFTSDNIDQVHDYFSKFGTVGSKKVFNENGKLVVEYRYQDRRAHSFIIYKEHRLFSQPVNITWDEVSKPFQGPQINNSPRNDTKRKINRNEKQDRPLNRKGGEKQDRPLNRKGADYENSKLAILENIKGENFAEQIKILQNKLQAGQEQVEKNKKIIFDDLTSALAPMFALSRICFFGSSITGLDVRGSDLDIYIANVREEHKPEVQTLKLIRHLIYKCRKFCDFLLISGAKTPIIKCIHTKTQMCCDLNIKNKLSVSNSELIKYYLNLDDKLRPFMIMIKFWAERYDLKKINFFSSYSLYMTVIFYLQQEPYNLPSVKDLQRDCTPDLVDGWNCAFTPLEFKCDALSTKPIDDLVAGFFKFYSNFDYIYDIISPYFGKIVKKTAFLKPYEIKQKQPLVVNSGICIQDPFELSRNVAAAVPLQCVGKFTAMCQIGSQLMNTESKDLYEILTYKNNINDYNFEIEQPEDKNEDEWTQTVKNLIEAVLKEVLHMKVIHTSSIYSCIGEYNIWNNRINIVKNLLTHLPADTSDLNREIAATKCIIKYFPQTLTTNMTVNVILKSNPTKFEIQMKPMNKKCRNFLHVSHFFRVKVLQFLENPSMDDDRVATPILPEIQENTADARTLSPSSEMTLYSDKVNDEASVRSGSSPGKHQVETKVAAEDDEEEDVPADFFDDFANEDFMDGLDIVDAWDEETKIVDTEESNEKKTHSPIRFVTKTPDKRRRKSRSKTLTRRYKRSNSRRSRSRSRDKARASDRRDPEKTRRDINRDKIKVAKDKEQKLVNDKLRIVETGLVPPGTEMEVDLNTIMKENKKHSPPPEREFVRVRERELVRERRYSPPRKRYSPSPRRVREREPVHRPRRRTASIDSNMSDRELWMRQSRKRTRSRTRESPRRSKTKKYEDVKKKKTFLEEIRDKLNETRTPALPVAPGPGVYSIAGYNNAAPHPIPAPAPTPVPAPMPNQFFPQVPNAVQQYDQSFFIGETYRPPQNVMMNRPQNVGFGIMTQMQPQMTVPGPVQAPVKAPIPAIVNDNLRINILSDAVVKTKENEEKKVRNVIEDIDKLFADKKISLSDFLTITAKCEAQTSSPEHLQKKIKVISRCQDAIKALSDDRKFTTGRLSVNPTPEAKNKTEVKYQSPLRRIPVVRFQFTSPAKITEEMDAFAVALDKVLQKVGVLRETIDLDESLDIISKLGNSSFADEASLLGLKKAEVMRSDCEECKKRKAKTFAEVGSQCADNKDTIDVGVQVLEEDLNPTKGLMKNDSIAYLTPAQLLGIDKEKEKEMEIATSENAGEKKKPLSTPPLKKERPKPPVRGRGRGGFQKTFRDRSFNNYDYEQDDYSYDVYDTGRQQTFDEEFGRRFQAPPVNNRFTMQQQYFEDEESHSMGRLQQFEEDDRSFMDYSQPSYRGRGGRFGPRF